MISRRSFLISAAGAAGVAVAQPVRGDVAGRGRPPKIIKAAVSASKLRVARFQLDMQVCEI